MQTCWMLLVFALLSPLFPVGSKAVARYQTVRVEIARVGEVHVQAFNDAGQIIGWYDTKNGQETTSHAFLWEKGKTIDLGTLPGDHGSRAMGINDRGQIVGSSIGNYEREHAFVWEHGEIRALNGTEKGSVATAINNRGQIVGEAQAQSGRWHACMWDGGKRIDLGILHPGAEAIESVDPCGINDRGQIVGISTSGCNFREAVLWENGSWHALGKGDYTQGEAVAINRTGEIIGLLLLADNNWHARLWQHVKPQELNFEPKGINDKGQIVGQFQDKVFLYEKGKRVDLEMSLLGRGEGPVHIAGINNRSQILCRDKQGVFVLVPTNTPIPFR